MSRHGLVLEYIVGGGLMQVDSKSIGPSFREEGWTMLSTIVEEWSRSQTDGEPWEVTAPLDPRVPQWFSIPHSTPFCLLNSNEGFLEQWCRLAAGADAIILIAPESGGELARLSAVIDEVSDARLGCRSPFLERASNKLLMAEYISDEFLHPQTLTPAQFQAYAKLMPAASQREWVIKPIDGAGCDGIWRGTAEAILTHLQHHPDCSGSLVQHYLPGIPASVAAWVTNQGRAWFPPVLQDIRWEKIMLAEGLTLEKPTYRGGRGPIEHKYWEKIHAFADRVLDLLGPGALGWIGIDFVLHLESDGIRCSVIEVNPRWTTSYAGLRQMYQGNLLEKLLELSTKTTFPLHFSADRFWSQQEVQWSVF